MKSPSISAKANLLSTHGLSGSLLRRGVLRQLAHLKNGQLLVIEEGERHLFGSAGSPLLGEIHILDAAAWGLVASNGSIGAGEAFIHGYWSSPDLTAVVRVFVSNLEVLDALEGGLARLGRPLVRALHWLNRNTRKGSQKNIAAHYDLGNELFEQFLDPTMMYSAAQFRSADDSLEQAQLNKLERICQKLDLKASDHLLEIGTGWGSMALYAAQHYGCQVTTTTLSKEQYDFTAQRIEALGLHAQVTLLLKDYRDLTGQYDKLVSIEMIEAVGQRYLPTFFRTCQARLRPGGRMAIQAITIQDQRYRDYSKSVDFIQRYIFPGGFLPSITAMNELMTRHTDFVVRNLFDMGPDYARTLAHWRQRFVHAWQEIEKLGFDERFRRMWLYYFGYCEAGFNARTISVVQLTAERV